MKSSRPVTGKWSGGGERDPLWAPFVLSGLGIAEGFNSSATAWFAWDRRHRGCPDLIILWRWRPDLQRYDLMDRYQRKIPRRGPRIPEGRE
jgi:hypothetical protein